MAIDTDKARRITFTNVAPENKEWSAHVYLLNEWTNPDRYLRHIVQYARSGEHFPADMHVDLIEQWAKAQKHSNVTETTRTLGDDMHKEVKIQSLNHGTICDCATCLIKEKQNEQLERY